MIALENFLVEKHEYLAYHGTNNDFSIFDKKMAGMGNDPGLRGRGFYFTPNIKTAHGYGKIVKKYKIILDNPFISSKFKSADDMADELNIDTGMFKFNPSNGEFNVYNSYAGRFTEALKTAGYDGVYYPQKQEIVVFNVKNIREMK